MQELPPNCEVFLFQYLQTWNGFSHLDTILDLIEKIKPLLFKSLYENILKPLSAIFFSSSPIVKVNNLAEKKFYFVFFSEFVLF